MKLLIIIINYRTANLTIDCLRSLADELSSSEDMKALIVDNLSGDDSPALIEEEIKRQNWSSWARCVRSERNGGFSAGNNIGFKSAKAEFYLLLNSDTLVRPGAIGALLKAAIENPKTGIIGPRLEWPDGTYQISTFRYHSPFSELIRGANTGPITRFLKSWDVPLQLHEVSEFSGWVSFAAVLIRREVMDRIGLMDEDYFMYFEDTDYCRRAVEHGWSVLYWPQARIVHLRGGTSPVKSLAAQNKRLPYYYYASRSMYYGRFYGRIGLWAANLLWMLGWSVSLLRKVLQGKERSACEREWADIWMNWLGPMKGRLKQANDGSST